MVYIKYFGVVLRACILGLMMFLVLDNNLAMAKCSPGILDKLLKQGFSKEEILQLCGENGQGSSNISPGNPDTTKGSTSTSREINIKWGNVAEYFEVRNIEIKTGFQDIGSKLSFLIISKGDFFGRMIVYYYDSDGVRICPPLRSIFSCKDGYYADDVVFETTKQYFMTPWQKGKSERANVPLSKEVVTAEFEFMQSKL